MAIAMCDSAIQWTFEKLGTGSDATCVSQATPTDCQITNSGTYTGECSGAPTGTCPTELQALINAWMKLRHRF